MRERPTHVAEVDGQVVAFYQLSSSPDVWQLQHFWVHPSFMNRGIGRGLLAHALEHVANGGGTYLEIDADPNAEAFYVACGAVRVGSIAASIEGEPDRVRPLLRLDVDSTR